MTETMEEPQAPPEPTEPAEPTPVEPDEPTEPEEPTFDGDENDGEPQTRAEGRCEAETTVGGTLYRCALQENHDGEHSFQPYGDDAEPEPAPSADLDAKLAKLQKRAASYSKGVAEILGDGLEGLIPCELCGPHWPGLRPPVALDADTIAKLRVVLGEPADENYVQDPESSACETCNGLGRVLTGSLVEKYRRLVCPSCDGRGYRTSRAATAEPVAEGSNVVPLASATDDTDPVPDTDPWGRPKGHPDYFRMPGYEQAS